MSWLSKAKDEVQKVIEHTIENPTPVVVGTMLAGPVGAALGVSVADKSGDAKEKQENAIQEYRQKMDQAITDLKKALPDYIELEKLWISLNTEGLVASYNKRYGDATPPLDILKQMILVDVESRRKELTDDEYKAELDELHQGSVEAGVQQLEHERDDPENQDKPSSTDPLNKFFGDFFTALGHWLEKRFDSNIDGAKNESGLGAKILRGGLGISWEDIKNRGLLGGDNSYLRKIVPTWSDNGGIFGGSNSFFRKPFG